MRPKSLSLIASMRPPSPCDGPELTLDEVEALITLIDGKEAKAGIIKSARRRLERQYLLFIPF